MIKVEEIVNNLKLGQVIIMPTDTTYGIVCDATNTEAVAKVYAAKKRDLTKPLLILVSDEEMLNKYTKELSSLEKELVTKYLPGPLTMLFLKNNLIPDIVTASSPYVGIRIPAEEDLQQLIKLLAKPIVATSANISGSEIITRVTDIEPDLISNIDSVIDGGIIEKEPSSLIQVQGEKIKILRDGKIAQQIIKDYASKIEKNSYHCVI